jgi:hypothetical protein
LRRNFDHELWRKQRSPRPIILDFFEEHLNKMKKLALALLLCGASAFATTVSYSTSAVLSGPDASGLGLSNGSAVLSYTGTSASVTSPSNINIGSITLSGTGTFTNDTILLTITQTVPSGGSQSSSSTISGAVSSTSSGVNITFAPTVFSIGSSNYTLQSTYFLVAPNTNNGITSLQASVTTTPEPGTTALLGAGLSVAGLVLRRRMTSSK